jgi:hypothetical protein
MNLIKLTQRDEGRLYMKAGELNRFKAKVLKSNLNLSDFEIYKDMDDPNRRIYIALKHNPKYHIVKTEVCL